MFLIRNAVPGDLSRILRLSQTLNQVNLSPNQEELEKQLQKSAQAFQGKLENKWDAEYIFVVEDVETSNIVGTSMIISQHGTRNSPHTYFQVIREERFSETLHYGVVHRILRLGFDYNGPTEIGGLIVDSEYRRRKEKLGKQVSFVRFMYMAMHRRRFKDRILSELLPPLTPDGKSLLWEALGRKFINLPYQEADKLSRANKEFIKTLFPSRDIYLSLLDPNIRALVGKVGEQTQPVKHMLEKIGFKYLEMIDPFDGGAHYGAKLKEITLIHQTKKCRLLNKKVKKIPLKKGLVAVDRKGDFRAVQTTFQIVRQRAYVSADVQDLLAIEPQEVFYVMPYKGDVKK